MSPRSARIVARTAAKPAAGAGDDTPMMEQFRRAKKEAPGALVFFRMGDFYELFQEDAVVAARELGLTLTSRAKGSAQPIPMAGVPVRSAEGYLVRLVRKGHKVAVCEQLEDPRKAKGIVDRGVVRIVTPGTLTEEDALDARSNNYLAAVWVARERAGLAWVDLSTGRLQGAELEARRIVDEIARVAPSELLAAPELWSTDEGLQGELSERLGITLTERESWRFDPETAERTLTRHFKVKGLEGFGVPEGSLIVPAAGALLEYVAETQKATCQHILRIEPVVPDEHLLIDRATRQCLELVETQREHRREGSLLDVLDDARTPMGSRLLRDWVLHPLRAVEPIRERQGGVAELVGDPFLREELREQLDEVHDVERLAGRISTGRASGRDLVALARSLERIPPICSRLEASNSAALSRLQGELDPLTETVERIRATLVDEPPLGLREGGLVRAGFSTELDEIRQISGDARSWMARFQAEESQRSGLPGLKIGFTSVFGYFIEVPRGQVDRVPDHYIRKQTLKGAERYVTPELKEFEDKVLNADARAIEREYEIFQELRSAVAAEIPRVLASARALSELDAVASLAHVAAAQRYVAPQVDEGGEIHVVDGRHPVIERSSSCEAFVPNDADLDLEGRRLTILTGPNMAGKSTYIRQVALIALLAQIGSFVPATEARIGIVDRIFTRVGAGDDISRGESTFMVEMVEIANILNNASRRSLVILDEVGRGTSTFDGLALAWAIAEHLHENVGCRTLFATHYHQLTDLTARYPGTVNKNVAVREWGDEIVFLHKIVDGGTDRSYGIHVARLAGVPRDVVERARSILQDLERDEEDLAQRILAGASAPTPEAAPSGVQLGLFAARSPIEDEISKLDLDRMAPLDALLRLRAFQERLGK
jgi:DNA mismatch repair protein MutS